MSSHRMTGALPVIFVLAAALAASPSQSKDHQTPAEFPAHQRIGPMLERALEHGGAEKSGSTTLVAIHGRGSREQLARAVQDVGATIDAASGSLAQARLTPDQVGRLSSHEAVSYLRLPFRASATAIESQSLAEIGVGHLHDLGHEGEGVRIAVLDIGFRGYTGQLGNELPEEVATQNFNHEGFETTNHGTAVAEIIHDIAPKAEITLVSMLTDVEFMSAVDWLIDQEPEIHIVNASLGFNNLTPPNGQSDIARNGDRLLEEGDILFVNSVGNDRRRYYSARFDDPDGNGWHNFNGEDEFLDLALNGGEHIELRLNWDDWGDNPEEPAAASDYDLFLWCPDTDGTDPADACLSSTAEQTGETFQRPLERVEENAPEGGTYRLGIRRSEPGVSRRIRLSFDGPGINSYEYSTPHTTLSSPADGQAVLAVGAFQSGDPTNDYRPQVKATDEDFRIEDWQAELPPQDYSARGPTWDDRHKPDMSGPDCVATGTLGAGGFCGTSAAAPHVAGAAALLKSQEPWRSGAALRRLLIATAEDVKPLGVDDAHGAGRVNLVAAAQKPGISTRSGAWSNVSQYGHGFFMEAIGDTLAVLWYVYDRHGEPVWLLSSGPMDSDSRYEGTILRFQGPPTMASPLASRFDAAGSTASHEAVGTLQLEFTGEATASASIALEGGTRLAPAEYEVAVDQFLIGPPASSSRLPYASPYSGLWHLPSQNGHGFIINRQGNLRSPNSQHFPTDRIAVAWFGYRNGGLPQWLLGSGTLNGAETFEKAGTSIGLRYFESFTGPVLDGAMALKEAFDRRGRSVFSSRSGNFTIEFQSRSEGTLNFRDGEDVSETLDLKRMDF